MASPERGRILSPRPIAAREIPLVNRGEEMKLLKEAVDRTVQGEGGLAFLYGEAGIGKTRLTRELAAYAALLGIQTLYGRPFTVFKMNGSQPYTVWKEVIRDYLQLCNSVQLFKVIGDYPAEVCKLIPEIRRKLGPVGQSLPISPEYERDRLFEGVSQLIINISKETPLLIILDDLHLSDQSSLLLLSYLARGAYKEHLLILGAYRDDEIDERHSLSLVQADLNKERLLQFVRLKRMCLDDVSTMIKQILERSDVSTNFCELVYEKTRGNPFFVEEIIKSLKEDGVIHRDKEKWQIEEAAKIEFPASVTSVIKRRVNRLDDECQNVLTLASFVGNDFSFETLLEITGFRESKLLGLIERMLKTGLIKEKVLPEKELYSFADMIVREVVHEEVSHLRQKRIHALVGCALEKVYAGRVEEHFGELASHFLEAGDKVKALDYCVKAGEKAAKVYANGEAVFYLQSALKLLEEKEGKLREKASVLETLGNVKKLVGEHDSCIKYWNDCLSLGEELRDNELVSRLHCKMANVLWENMGDTEKAKFHHEIALKILENESETVALVSLYEDIASQFSMSGESLKSLPWAQKALDLAKRMNSNEALGLSYVTLGSIMNWAGDKDGGLECIEKGLRIALDNGFLDTAVYAYNEVAGALPEEETEKIIENYEKGYALARKIGTIARQSWLAASLASYYMGRGDMNKAILMADESVALDKKSGNVTHLSISLGRLGSAYLILGEWDKSEQYFNEAFSISLGLNDFQSAILSYRNLGRLYFERGDYQRAREQHEKMLEVCENAGAKYHPALMRGLIHIIWTYIELGESAKANDLTETLHDFAVKTKDNYLVAHENVLKGMLLRTQKKWEKSIMQFESGIKQLEAIGANRWDVHTFAKMVLCEFARVYLERERQGDKEKAYSLLNQASEIFQKIGAKKDMEKTVKLIEVLHPPSTQISEKKVSPEILEYTKVQGKVIVTPRELRVGEIVELEIELTNTSEKEAVRLTKITGIVPDGFVIAKRSELYRVEENCLNMKEKRLDPLKKEEVELALRPKIKGTFHIKPKIVYLNDDGKEKTFEPNPITITVKELGIKGWLKGER